MIAVAGHWELSWNTPIKEAELWNLVLRDFAVEDWWMWPVSGIRQNEKRWVHLYERPDIKTILAEVDPDLQRVYAEPKNIKYPHDGADLPDFDHPENVLYIFGSIGNNPMIGNFRPGVDLSLTIPTVHNTGVPWPHQCLMVILYDRLVKKCR